MKRKTVLFLIAILLAVSMLPLSASAYEGGLLDGKVLHYARTDVNESRGTSSSMTDNQYGTHHTMSSTGNKYVYYEFATEKDIDGYILYTQSPGVFYLEGYDSEGNLIDSVRLTQDYESPPATVKTLDEPIKNVKKVALFLSSSASNVMEFDVFGTDSPEPEPEPEPPSYEYTDSLIYGIPSEGRTGFGDAGVLQTSHPVITDGDETTRIVVAPAQFHQWRFSKPHDITAIRLHGGNIETRLWLMDSNGETSEIVPSNLTGEVVEVDYKNITIIGFVSTKGAYYNEFAVYGTESTGGELPPPDETDPEDPPPLSSPKGLSATVGDGTVTLTWEAYAGAMEYKVYRNGDLLTTVTETTYTDSGLSNGQTYKYGVSAVTADGESVQSMLNVKPVKNAIELKDVVLPFSVRGMVENSVGFLSLYGMWIVIALGVIFSPVLFGLVMKLVDYVSKRAFDGKHGKGSSAYWGAGGTHEKIMSEIKGNKPDHPYDEKITRWKW